MIYIEKLSYSHEWRIVNERPMKFFISENNYIIIVSDVSGLTAIMFKTKEEDFDIVLEENDGTRRLYTIQCNQFNIKTDCIMRKGGYRGIIISMEDAHKIFRTKIKTVGLRFSDGSIPVNIPIKINNLILEHISAK